jgi:glycerol-3-phosphate dehydrogenase (NAD(P)+)
MQFGMIGGGSWATALAKILTDNGNTIHWWMRNTDTIAHLQKRRHNPHYLGAAYFDVQQIQLSSNLEQVIHQSDVLVIAIPSAYAVSTLANLPSQIFAGKKIVSAIKGMLPNTNQLLNEYLADAFAVAISDYYTVLGPCHAEEVAAEKLSYLTFSGIDAEITANIAAHFKTEYMNTVVNADVWGVQYAAILKNIYALGAGIAHGLEYGDNFLSVYIANAAREMGNFLQKMVEQNAVCPNYAASVYLGDLLVTCYSLYSRNRTFGNMIGKGYSVKAAQLELNMVAEGYNASKCIHLTNKTLKAEMPIAAAIYNILWNHLSAKEGFRTIEQILL